MVHCLHVACVHGGSVGSLVVRTLDLQLDGCEFNSRPQRRSRALVRVLLCYGSLEIVSVIIIIK